MKVQKDITARKVGAGMTLLAWISILAVLTLLINNWLDDRNNPNREVIGRTLEDGAREIRLQQNRYGHYVAEGSINGMAVRYLLDTGATEVAIPAHMAEMLGLSLGLPRQMKTANGIITTYSTRLRTIQLGPVELTNVRAQINPNMYDDEILLGMTFLRHLELIQRDGRLTLRQQVARE